MKKFFLTPMLSLLAVIFVAVPLAFADDNEDFVNKASKGDAFEMEISKLALEKSQNPSVKKFAQRMVDDHAKMGEELKSAVAAASLKPETIITTVDSSHQRMIDNISKETGADFDKSYAKAQLKVHDKMVNLFQDYSKKGENAALKDFAVKHLPMLLDHQESAKQLKASL